MAATLVVGSMSTVADGSYEKLVADCKSKSQEVRAEMLDRILDEGLLCCLYTANVVG